MTIHIMADDWIGDVKCYELQGYVSESLENGGLDPHGQIEILECQVKRLAGAVAVLAEVLVRAGIMNEAELSELTGGTVRSIQNVPRVNT